MEEIEGAKLTFLQYTRKGAKKAHLMRPCATWDIHVPRKEPFSALEIYVLMITQTPQDVYAGSVPKTLHRWRARAVPSTSPRRKGENLVFIS